MKKKSICVYITSKYNSKQHKQVLKAVQNALDKNMLVSGIFFHDQAVALANTKAPSQTAWTELSESYNIPLYACINSLKQQCIVHSAKPFIIGSLGDLVELQTNSDIMLTEQQLSLNTRENQKPKTHLFIFEHAPYQNSLTQSGIDNLFAHASLGRKCQVLLKNDGIKIATQTEPPKRFKNTFKQLSALPLYDIDDIFECGEHIQALTNYKQLSVDELANMVHNASFIFHY